MSSDDDDDEDEIYSKGILLFLYTVYSTLDFIQLRERREYKKNLVGDPRSKVKINARRLLRRKCILITCLCFIQRIR